MIEKCINYQDPNNREANDLRSISTPNRFHFDQDIGAGAFPLFCYKKSQNVVKTKILKILKNVTVNQNTCPTNRIVLKKYLS